MTEREIYRVESLPTSQNKMFPSEESARSCPTGDVVLVQDMTTGLIFNSAFIQQLLDYRGDYQNEQACSPVFQKHLQEVQEIIVRNFRGRSVVEIGCGKGYFLGRLRQIGYDAVGIDPAYEGDSPHVVRASFSPEMGISAEGVVLRHVLEHLANPLGILASIARANRGAGKIYIEVPCFDWIIRQRAWFDIFYEHVNYFRRADLLRMFGVVYESGYLFKGQYLYVVADLATLREPRMNEQAGVRLPGDFLDGIRRCRTRANAAGRKAIWGGASKGVIFALLMQRANIHFDFVIDINPAKQNKYLACSGLRVSSPEDALQALRPGDPIFVMNSNYLHEVVTSTKNQFVYLTVDNDDI